MNRHAQLSFSLAAVLVFALLGPTALAAAAPIAGDVNFNGRVDATDVQLVINAALGIPVAFITNLDLDAQNKTNATDIQLEINAALGIAIDRDHDGLCNAAEANLGTNPDSADSDGGGVDDGTERLINHTNPLVAGDDNGTPVKPTANFTANITSGPAPLTVQFTDTSTAGSQPITTWFWSFGDTATSTSQNPSHQYTQPGTYDVSLLVASSAGNDTKVQTGLIVVGNAPKPQIHWIGTGDGNWGDSANWEGGKIPTASDVAIVDVPGKTITVTVNANTSIADAQIQENLTVSGNVTLTETGEMTVAGAFALANGGFLNVTGAGAHFIANGPTDINEHTVQAANGGVASFPQLTSYSFTKVANPTLFQATGAGSRIEFPALATLTFNDGQSHNITAYLVATDSGAIDVHSLLVTSLGAAHHLEFRTATAGTIDASALPSATGLNLNVGAGSTQSLTDMATLGAANLTVAGTLDLPALTTLANSSLAMTGAGTLTAPLLTAVTNSTVTTDNTSSATLPKLANLLDTSLTLRGGSSLTLPLLAAWTTTKNGIALSVYDTAVFSAPALAGMTDVTILVRSGAKLTLPALTAYTFNLVANPTLFDVANSGSEFNAPALAALTFNDGQNHNITAYLSASDSGHIDVSALTNVSLGTGHHLQLSVATGGTIDAGALPNATGLNLSVAAGATLTLPSLTSLDTFNLTGAGTLNLPNLTTLTNSTLALSGAGILSAPLLATLTNSAVTLDNTSSATLPKVTNLLDTGLTLRGQSSLSLPLLAAWNASKNGIALSVYDTATFSAATLAGMTNVTVLVRNGAKVTLPALTAYTFNLVANPTAIDVANAGSEFNVPALATLTFNDGQNHNITLYVQAATGGHIDLSGMTAISLGAGHHMTVTSDGAGTVVTLSPGLVKPANLTLTATNGGTIVNAKSGALQSAAPFEKTVAPRALLEADLNGDEVPDRVSTDSEGVVVQLGLPDGSLGPETRYAVSGGSQALALGDFNDDGAADLIVSNDGVSVLPGLGDGTFGAEWFYALDSAPQTLRAYDRNGDGITDIVATLTDPARTVVLNGAPGR